MEETSQLLIIITEKKVDHRNNPRISCLNKVLKIFFLLLKNTKSRERLCIYINEWYVAMRLCHSAAMETNNT